jgi:hypothetical protein
MSKTYYGVVYAVWGADNKKTAWFDDKTEAYNFASHDYRDDPITHNVSNPETIKKYDELVKMTAYSLDNI